MERMLDVTETRQCYEKMRTVFKRIVNNDNINNLTHPLDFDDCYLNHQRKDKYYERFGERPYDYLFIVDGKFYGLDISLDADDLGYNDEYIYQNYKDSYENLYCISLTEFNKDVVDNDINILMSFIYDRKNKKIVEVLDLSKYSYIDDEKYPSRGNKLLLKSI